MHCHLAPSNIRNDHRQMCAGLHFILCRNQRDDERRNDERMSSSLGNIAGEHIDRFVRSVCTSSEATPFQKSTAI